jgi:hypothetical protein
MLGKDGRFAHFVATRKRAENTSSRTTTFFVANDSPKDLTFLQKKTSNETITPSYPLSDLQMRKKTFRMSMIPMHLVARSRATTISRRRSIDLGHPTSRDSPGSTLSGLLHDADIVHTESFGSTSSSSMTKRSYLNSSLRRLSVDLSCNSSVLAGLVDDDFADIASTSFHKRQIIVEDEYPRDRTSMGTTEKLHDAILRRQYDEFMSLLAEEETDYKEQGDILDLNCYYLDEKGRTLLHTAARFECIPVMNALLEKGIRFF